MSRREAAALLGFASEFKVRQLEKEGRLHPIRGVMGSAWYPRSEVVALGGAAAAPGAPNFGRGVGSPAIGRWQDAALIRHLRAAASPNQDGGCRAPTVVDLVADTGVSIARAEKVYRFWLAHDHHPVAAAVRAGRGGEAGAKGPTLKSVAATVNIAAAARFSVDPPPGERRGGERLERDTLILDLRNPDPGVRALAFRRLKDKQKR